MAGLKAFYLRDVTDNAISEVRTMFPSMEIRISSEFIGLIWNIDAKISEQALMELSSRLETDVIWLSYQSVVDAFEYYHWQAGVLLRALVYGCYIEERTWERIEGQPEAWERAAFFDPETLAFILEDEDSDEEKQQLEQFWQTGELVIGRTEPYLSAGRCAHDIGAYYRFPAWN